MPQPGQLLAQLRKQRLAAALLRIVDKALHYKRSALEVQRDQGTQATRQAMGDEISVELYKSFQRLRNELDPLHVAASHCTDTDVVMGALGGLRHSVRRQVESALYPVG